MSSSNPCEEPAKHKQEKHKRGARAHGGRAGSARGRPSAAGTRTHEPRVRGRGRAAGARTPRGKRPPAASWGGSLLPNLKPSLGKDVGVRSVGRFQDDRGVAYFHGGCVLCKMQDLYAMYVCRQAIQHIPACMVPQICPVAQVKRIGILCTSDTSHSSETC